VSPSEKLGGTKHWKRGHGPRNLTGARHENRCDHLDPTRPERRNETDRGKRKSARESLLGEERLSGKAKDERAGPGAAAAETETGRMRETRPAERRTKSRW
jgi:hypothetical protein